MNDYFYTNVYLSKDKIFCRGYAKGERFQDELDYKPYLFIKGKSPEDWHTLDGECLEKLHFKNVDTAKKYALNHEVFGNQDFVYQYINDEFPGVVEFDPSLISVVTVDIEVIATKGFPDTKKAEWPISAITMTRGGKVFVLGLKPYRNKESKANYIQCRNETSMLEAFIDTWKKLDPDIVTGWNIEKFDIPYLINRIGNLLGVSAIKRLSPFRSVWEQEVETNKDKYYQYHIRGVSIIDYLPLYKKFKLGNEESYSLNHIAKVEIGEEKIDYSEHGTLNDLYESDHDLYIDYNIYDCVLVDKINKKLNYIGQAVQMAYNAKVNYNDVFGTVKPWDIMITNYLLDRKMVVPQPSKNEPTRRIAGGFVKEPQAGFHKWVVTIDLVSMYPHIIMGCNISPEKIISYHKTEVHDLLKGIPEDIAKLAQEKNVVLTPTVYYDRKNQGFFPALMEKLFTQRAEAKVKLKEAKKNNDEYLIAKLDNYQNAQKILLNGGYGAMANEYFRFYDEDMAESVTSTGQYLIRFIEHKINRWMNNALSTDNVDYVVAIDTDSIHLTLDALVTKLGLDGSDRTKIVSTIDKIFKEKILPLTGTWCTEFSTGINAVAQKFKFNREVIADKAIWRAAKMYIMNVIDDEGMYQDPPKIKMKGIEAVRSSTPLAVRAKIKQTLFQIMNTDEKTVQDACAAYKQEFLSLPFNEIASPSSVKGLTKYHHPSTIYISATPMHVKGCLIYNYLLQKYGLENKYPHINDGDKIRYSYLKMPNIIHQTVIAASDELPEEFGLMEYIDKERQFEKVFQKPIESILEAIRWTFVDHSQDSIRGIFAELQT